MRKIFLPIFCYTLLLIGILLSSNAWALDVLNVRFGQHPDKLRTVIELSESVQYNIISIPAENGNPNRIVIDFPTFQWRAGALSLPKDRSVIKVQSGEASDTMMRVIIDMAKPTTILKSFILPAGSGIPTRLVIDTQSGINTVTPSNVTPRAPTKTLTNVIAEQMSPNATPTIAPPKQNTPTSVIVPPRKPASNTLSSLNKNDKKPPAQKSPLRKPLIVIDAGHGGQDPGAVGAQKLKEKDITLAAAKVLKSTLENTGRYNVHLTRSDDRYLKLYSRVNIARDKDADLFISLHADSIGQSDVRGASIYTLSNKASDAQTAKLAARENRVDLIAGVDLSHEDKDVANILIDLAMRDTMNQSKFFANTVVGRMGAYDIKTLTKPHRYAGFAVLKAPDIPSVLVEMGFMSNSQEARTLATPAYQRKIADALTASIDTYFSKVRKNP